MGMLVFVRTHLLASLYDNFALVFYKSGSYILIQVDEKRQDSRLRRVTRKPVLARHR